MTSGGSGRVWEQRLHEASGRAEEELRRLIGYINDEVVPEVRRNGSVALRRAATELNRLAEQMDEGPRPPGDSAR